MHRALRGATIVGFELSLVFAANSLWGGGAPPQREFAAKTRDLINEAQRASSGKRALLVGDQAPRTFKKEKALGLRRAERASPEKADHSKQANQRPSQGAYAWCARCVFFCA